jgi:hypothetical protein
VGTRPVLLISVDCARSDFGLSGYCARNNLRENSPYQTLRIRKTGQAKTLHMLNRLKNPSEYNVFQEPLNQVFKNTLLSACYSFYRNKGTRDPMCKQCKVSLK